MTITIANPIYDTVFKYLVEDLDIAKGMLSAILDVEIVELSIKPQETVAETEQNSKPIRIYRIDFAAVIKQKDGSYKKVLIELQKTKRNTNILRFRRYLAENYQKEEVIVTPNGENKQSLEIVTIYFLGFNLDEVPTSVLHIKNCFTDVTTGETLETAKNEEFVRLLNHESYIIQIRKLAKITKTRLERVLSIFNQSYKTSDEHALNYQDSSTDDPLLQMILKRLFRAIADEDMRRKMDIEDEFDREYQDLENRLEQNKQELEQNKQELEQNKQELEQNKQELEQNKQELAERDREIAELKKLLENKNQ